MTQHNRFSVPELKCCLSVCVMKRRKITAVLKNNCFRAQKFSVWGFNRKTIVITLFFFVFLLLFLFVFQITEVIEIPYFPSLPVMWNLMGLSVFSRQAHTRFREFVIFRNLMVCFNLDMLIPPRRLQKNKREMAGKLREMRSLSMPSLFWKTEKTSTSYDHIDF